MVCLTFLTVGVFACKILQAVCDHGTLQFTKLYRQYRDISAAVQQVFQVPYHGGLDLPHIQKAILDRLTRITRILINEPVQQGCLGIVHMNLTLKLIRPDVIFKGHRATSGAVRLLFQVRIFHFPEIQGDVFG